MDSTPTSADAVVTFANTRLAALLQMADALPEFAVSEDFRGQRVADVLAHLHAWNVLLVGWIDADDRGEVPDYPMPGYTWDQLDQLNDALVAQHAHRPYDEVRALLTDSHARACAAVAAHDDDRLFDAKARPWLGGLSLGYVAHDCLGAHYAWGEGVLGQCAQ